MILDSAHHTSCSNSPVSSTIVSCADLVGYASMDLGQCLSILTNASSDNEKMAALLLVSTQNAMEFVLFP